MTDTLAKTTIKKAIALFSIFAVATIVLLLLFSAQPTEPQIVTVIEESGEQGRIALLEEELLKAKEAEALLEAKLTEANSQTDVNSLAYAAYWRGEAERLSRTAEITGSSLKEVEGLIRSLEEEREELKSELTALSEAKLSLTHQKAMKAELEQAKNLKSAAEKRLAELGNEVTRQRKTLEALEVSRGSLLNEMERTKRSVSQLKELKTPHEREVVLVETVQHTVRPGETLMNISEQYYGTSKRWRQILEANLSKVPDERKLKPGIVLVIPSQN